jgi:lipoyl-dependent peroxiredoxin
MGLQRTANAVWKGGLKDGKGTLTTAAKALNGTAYSFTSRFESGVGTNPEELIAAAHAGCFSMALSGKIDGAGLKAESIETKATVSMEKQEPGWTVTKVHLDVVAKVPNATPEAFAKLAEDAKKGCPISRLLAHLPISMTAKLA